MMTPTRRSKPPGIDALQCVIASLRDTSKFSDEEGELTQELRKLRDWALAQDQRAIRYEYLRERDLDTITAGGVFAGMTPNNVVLNGIDLDQAIDAEIAAGKGAKA